MRKTYSRKNDIAARGEDETVRNLAFSFMGVKKKRERLWICRVVARKCSMCDYKQRVKYRKSGFSLANIAKQKKGGGEFDVHALDVSTFLLLRLYRYCTVRKLNIS